MSVPDYTERSLGDLVDLRTRRAVVTGAAQGIGAAIAARLAEAGASVVIADIDEAAASTTAADLANRYDANVIALPVDVTDASSVAALAQGAITELGGMDIWVNNAGVYPSKPLVELTEDDWDRVLDINVRGTFLGCREAAQRMVPIGHGGVIVNVSSIAGIRGRQAGVTAYVASKHAIIGITRQVALELAPAGIRVLAVAPTTILTPGVVSALGPDTDLDDRLMTPLGRAGRPDDVARVVLFCATDLAGFMTGSTLLVDAGEMAI